jgi:hypothetical protein
MDCSVGTVNGYPLKGGSGKQYIRIDCGKLTCPKCGWKKAKKYLKAVTKQAERLKLRRFLTLTLDPALIPEGVDSIQHLRACWAKLRVYIGRSFPHTSYISVVELHKSGIAHLHILVSRFIPQPWIKKTWQAIGAGRIVFIKIIDMHRIGAYLTKYITKELLLMVPWRKKRISTSRDIKLFEKKESSGWNYERRNISEILQDYLDFGKAKVVFKFEFDREDETLSRFSVLGEYST